MHVLDMEQKCKVRCPYFRGVLGRRIYLVDAKLIVEFSRLLVQIWHDATDIVGLL